MQSVVLKPLLHRGAEQMGIYFQKDTRIENAVRRIKGVKWSQTHNCWYVSLTRATYRHLVVALQGLAKPEISEVKAYLAKRKQVQTVAGTKPALGRKAATSDLSVWNLCEENFRALERFIEQLKLKAYSPSTIKTYRNELLQLLQILKNKPVNDLTPNDLRRYFVYCFEKLKLTENTLHSRINAIKFYFEKVVGREKFFGKYRGQRKHCNCQSF